MDDPLVEKCLAALCAAVERLREATFACTDVERDAALAAHHEMMREAEKQLTE